MKKLFAVLLAVLVLVGVPAAYASTNDYYTEYCSQCAEWTSWCDEELPVFTDYDDNYHLVSFYVFSTCTKCGMSVQGEFITDSLESHSFNEDGICEVCHPQEN